MKSYFVIATSIDQPASMINHSPNNNLPSKTSEDSKSEIFQQSYMKRRRKDEEVIPASPPRPGAYNSIFNQIPSQNIKLESPADYTPSDYPTTPKLNRSYRS